MLVGRAEFLGVLARLTTESRLAFDVETTGLRPYQDSQLFSLVVATQSDVFYFNFLPYEDLDLEYVLPREWLSEFQVVFGNRDAVYFAHNAKFDLAMLSREGIEVLGTVHCTEAMARLLGNVELTYTLDACVTRLALATNTVISKDHTVEWYINKYDLWAWEQEPGKAARKKNKFFAKVPVDIMAPYARRDGEITMRLGEWQEDEFLLQASTVPPNLPSILALADNERRLTKTLFKMERVGVAIDKAYCEEAIKYEEARAEKATSDFKSLTGQDLVDSGKALKGVFAQYGFEVPNTEKGNPSVTDEFLARTPSPVSQIVQTYRDATKRVNTYFRSFVWLVGADGAVHCNFRQGGTATGRVSCTNPNIQSAPKEDEGPFKVRRAFIPRPNFFFFAPDYSAMEYRVMLDYAGEDALIERIKAGMDVHQATAELIGTSRKQAKSVNFACLYGAGIEKLADMLGTSLKDARRIRGEYFSKLPRVQNFIKQVVRTAELRGYVYNRMGRRCAFPDPRFSYKAPNYLIQGGCADVVKLAMNRIDDFLINRKSRMLLQIHDEILFEVHESERHICPELIAIMEQAYTPKSLPMQVVGKESGVSWGDVADA